MLTLAEANWLRIAGLRGGPAVGRCPLWVKDIQESARIKRKRQNIAHSAAKAA